MAHFTAVCFCKKKKEYNTPLAPQHTTGSPRLYIKTLYVNKYCKYINTVNCRRAPPPTSLIRLIEDNVGVTFKGY